MRTQVEKHCLKGSELDGSNTHISMEHYKKGQKYTVYTHLKVRFMLVKANVRDKIMMRYKSLEVILWVIDNRHSFRE